MDKAWVVVISLEGFEVISQCHARTTAKTLVKGENIKSKCRFG